MHAFDAYTGRLLKILLEAHASQGGSAILLSATLPNDLRSDLVAAFQRGLGVPVTATSDCTELEMPYPLATQAGETVSTTALATRPQVKRRVKVDFLHDVGAVFALIHAAVDAGQCVCWIRNSVDDAREAWSELQQAEWLDRDKLMLFHSRFALVDRLSIENAVIDTLGKKAQSAERRGRVLVSTQVIEQSLDLDADVMISDLAPVDLLIQRAGRLHRHLRDAAGNPATTESRPAAVLHIFAPQFQAEPAANWYSSQFPRAAFVYADTGRLWLTQKVLLKEGAILMPERARHLIEAVYGRYADAEIPSALLAATDSQIGKELSDRSLARSNALQLEQGYCRESGAWDAEERTPTRIGEEDREFVLLQDTENGLQAWAADQRHRWAASTIKIAARKLDRIAPAWDQRFVKELAELRAAHRALRYVGLLPLVACGMNWQAEGLAARGRPVKVIYDRQIGLQTERGGG